MTQVLPVIFQIRIPVLQLQTQNISIYKFLAIDPGEINSLGTFSHISFLSP